MDTPIPKPIHIRELEIEEKIRDLLTAMSLDELLTVPAATLKKLEDTYKDQKSAEKELEKVVHIETPATKDYEYMRTSMFATLLESVRTKLDAAKDRVGVFEVGRVYFEDPSGGDTKGGDVKGGLPYREARRIAGVLSGNVDIQTWVEKPRKYTWNDAKGIIAEILEEIGVKFEFKKSAHPSFEDGTAIQAVSGKKTIAWVGQLASRVSKKRGIKQDAYCFEIDIDELVKCRRSYKNMSRWSEYPKVLRDISVIVDEDVKSGEVLKRMKKTAGDILYSVEPLSVYTGDKVPSGKKNILYALTYWSKEKTLTADEIEKVHKEIGKSLVEKLDAEIAGWGKSSELGRSEKQAKKVLKNLIVGKILKVEKHPDADKLHVVTVDLGEKYPKYKSGEKIIICGAANIVPGTEGVLVPVALPGTEVLMATNKERTEHRECAVKEMRLRGVKSSGMLCSEKELGKGEEDEGIMILDPDKYSVGQEFF